MPLHPGARKTLMNSDPQFYQFLRFDELFPLSIILQLIVISYEKLLRDAKKREPSGGEREIIEKTCAPPTEI